MEKNLSHRFHKALIIKEAQCGICAFENKQGCLVYAVLMIDDFVSTLKTFLQ